jgi:hypothetical protein
MVMFQEEQEMVQPVARTVSRQVALEGRHRTLEQAIEQGRPIHIDRIHPWRPLLNVEHAVQPRVQAESSKK